MPLSGGGGGALAPAASSASVAATQAAGGERALVLGDWKAAAELGLAALAGGGGGAAAQRGACVAIQALFELGRFEEAHPALVAGFGGPMGVPPDALMLWAALGLDAGSASTVAAELAAYLDAAAVPGGRGPPPRGGGEASGGAAATAAAAASPSQAGGGGALHASGPVLTRDQYETAARLLLVEALCREAGRPGDALAWTDGGGLAPLTAERAAALRGEVVGAAAGAAAAPPAAAVTPAIVPPPAPQPAAGPAKIPPTPFAPLTPPSPPQPAALAADAGPAGLGGGPTVALGAGALGAVARSASFLAATPERLADLWRSPSAAGGVGDEIGGGGGNGPPRLPLAKPAALPPAGLGLPAAAAAAAAAGVLAYAAFAERRALGRALRAAAARLGVVDAARAAFAVGVAR